MFVFCQIIYPSESYKVYISKIGIELNLQLSKNKQDKI